MTDVRPIEHLNTMLKLYPNMPEQVDMFRSGKGVDLPDWPEGKDALASWPLAWILERT